MPKLNKKISRFGPWGLYYDGVGKINKKEFDEAISIFNKLISKLDPGGIVLRYKIYPPNCPGQCCSLINKLSEFQKFWLIKAYGNRGVCFGYKKQYQEAINDFDDVLKIDNRNIKSLHNKAHIRLINKDFDTAIEDLSKIISIDPEHSKSYLKRGMAYREIGENEKGYKDLNYHRYLIKEKNVKY